MLGRADRRLRRPRRLDERDRPRARAGRLLRDRRRQSIAAATGAALSAQAHGQRRGRLLRRRRHQPGLLPRVPELRRRSHALPVVFVCENNFYGEFTPMQQVTAGARHRGPRAPPTACRRAVVDGNDLWAVARGGARGGRRAPAAGDGPTLLECQTYRHYGHSKSDPATYRPEEEVERWLERDPLKLTRARLLELGVSRGRDRRDRGARSRAELDRAVEAALAAPYPTRPPTRRRSTRHERARVPRRRSATRSPRRSSATRASSSSARTSPPPAACSRSRPGCTSASAHERVFDTPISELALAGAAFGAAVTGLRPVIEIMFGDFMALPMDSLVNQAAKYWYISNEQGDGPARRALGGRRRRPLRRHALADRTAPGSRASRG